MFTKNTKLVFTFSVLGLFVIILSLNIWRSMNQTPTSSTETNSEKPIIICWNRVIAMDNQYYWPDGCRGNPKTESMICTTALVALTPEEQNSYLEWLNTKPELDPKCYD